MFDIPIDIPDNEDDLSFDQLRCVVKLQFLGLHLWFAENGTFFNLRGSEKCLAGIGEFVASDKPYAAYVKVAYDHFMHVLEQNKAKAAPPHFPDGHNYAARSANMRAASMALKETLRQHR